MYIRRVKKQRSPNSKIFYQYTLAQTTRQGKKVKQRNILYLGSDTELDDKNNRATVLAALKAGIQGRQALFPTDMPVNLKLLIDKYIKKYYLKYGDEPGDKGATLPPDAAKANYQQVDINALEVTEVRSFGAEHLCGQTLDKLQLADCLRATGMKNEMVVKSLISIVARAVFCVSEHKTAQILEMNSELSALYGYDNPITHKQLYQGNKADSTTVDDMLCDLEKHSAKNNKCTVVIDAGIATEDNLALIAGKGHHYVCVSPKRLKDYEMGTTVRRLTDRGKNTVELAIFRPPDYTDTWMYVKSEAKRKKETSMDDKLCQRYEEELENIRSAFSKKGGTRKIDKVWERIGRVKEKNKRVSAARDEA